MAHHPNKFASVNLNRSYGPQPQRHPSSLHGRGRASPGGGGGGGMVVLSRPRSSGSTPAARLAVPPPLNLPSLRKESERLDPSAAAAVSSGRPGSGHGPSAPGWSRSGLLPPADKNPRPQPSAAPIRVAEKVAVLLGEDFPTLSATVASEQKQREFLSQRQRHQQTDEPPRSPLHMRPQPRSSQLISSPAADKMEPFHALSAPEPPRKLDSVLPGPLPVIRLTHTNNWADDERDTGFSIPGREHDSVSSRTEMVRGLELPNVRSRDADGAQAGDYFTGDSSSRIREGRDVSSSWRSQLQPGLRNASRVSSKENNFYAPYSENVRDTLNSTGQDSWHSRRDASSGTSIPNGRYVAETTSMRGSEQSYHGKYGDSSSGWFKKDVFQNGSMTKNHFSSGNKGFSLNDPILNSSRDKRLITNNSMPYLEDAVIGSMDLLEEMNIKVLKRKKEIHKQADFHDPVRESFEAELERVQRLQELERKKAMEEQARILELACKEREEKERLAREEEEQRYQLEEEAREAAWRAESERLELAKIAQKQKTARAEEKRLILVEEERRKEAARQKLLELEEKIARRQAEVGLKGNGFSASDIAVDEQVLLPVNNGEVPRTLEYEGLERRVEHMNSNASESSGMNSFSNTHSRTSSSKDGNSMASTERAKHVNYSRRDVYDRGNNLAHNTHHQPRQDVFISGIGMPRQDYHRNSSMMPHRPYSEGERADPSKIQEDLHLISGDRWNHFGTVDKDHWNRNSDVDAELLDNFGGNGREPDHSCGTPHAGYEENLLHNSNGDGFSSGRSRYSLKQPRVLPPPSMSSVQRNSFRGVGENTISSFLDDEVRCHHVAKNLREIIDDSFEGSLEGLRRSGSGTLREKNPVLELQHDTSGLRCDSQSSLSVSSPPNSPTHLSHDDLEESGDSPVIQSHAFGAQILVSDKEHVESLLEIVDTRIIVTSNSVFPGEEDEWAIEGNDEMRIQDEYEENNGYEEEDEAQDDDDNIDMVQKLDDLQFSLQETGVSGKLVGFNEDTEVRMPIDDDLEGTSRDVVKAMSHSAGPTDSVQELFEDVDVNQPLENTCPRKTLKDSSIIVNEIKNTLEELVLVPVVSSCLPESAETSPNTSEISTLKSNLPPLSLPAETSPLAHPISSPTSNAINQTDGSANLQFGLFSGPSLIQPPLPAIQIGSFHMPLHLQPHVGPIANSSHSSQPPMFQFGQLRYLQPISQGILPLASQALSFVQRPASTQRSLNHNLMGSFHSKTNTDSSTHNIRDILLSHPLDKKSSSETNPIDLAQGSLEHKQSMSMPDGANNVNLASHSQAASLAVDENVNGCTSGAQAICHASYNNTLRKNRRSVGDGKNTQSHLHADPVLTQFFPRELSGPRASGMGYGGRGRRLAYAVRNTGARSSFPVADTSYANSGIIHKKPRKNINRNVRRTEFRVRDTSDKRPTESSELPNSIGDGEKTNSASKVSEIAARNGGRRDPDSSTSANMIASERRLNSDVSYDKEAASKSNVPSMLNLHNVDGKRNENPEEEVDAPFQSGYVCVFKQPGIEAPSDEDDFIQVRSKRQMLNDRREQREKDIKAKFRMNKAFRKNHTTAHDCSSTNPKRAIVSMSGGHAGGHSDPPAGGGRNLSENDRSPVFTANLTSQTLAPIGSPVLNAHTVGRSNSPIGETKLIPGSSMRNKRAPFANRPEVSWEKKDINKQVLTQIQLDEAIKPVNFESPDASSVAPGLHKPAAVISEHTQLSPSILMQESMFSSSKDSLNILFSGEKIQFGAVTSSPVILPPVTQSTADGIYRPGSCRPDASIEHSMTGKKNDVTALFEKEKNQVDSSTQIEDPEAEAAAEAAASAVAVAVISSSDELVGCRLGVSVSISDAKNFGTSDASGMSSIVAREMTCQSSEESLSVSLPADLSDDNPAFSLWPPIPSPHGSSGSMLSHFPRALPSHFPCFEMNPIVEAPLFAFGPHEESASNQADSEVQGQAQLQARRSMTIGSGSVGSWPHCHSGMDSFYGPHAGFAGPFINPTGIPGIQGPPHMIVYNHFTPVGQFGQLGISYMGTTYIPTGKQPDWKHTPAPSGVSEGDASNISVVSGQCNPLSMSVPPLQHVAHGSPLIPMSSQSTMFDMHPFQSSAELPAQARWPHIPAPPVHALPISMPLQQPQMEGGIQSRFNHKYPLDKNKSTQIDGSHSSRPLDATKNIPVTNDVASQFPDELVLMDAPLSTIASNNSQPTYTNVHGNNKLPNTESSADNIIDSSMSLANSSSGKAVSVSSNQNTYQQQNDIVGHSRLTRGHLEHRAEAHHHRSVSSGFEWHRKTGYRGRNQNFKPGSFGPPKVRQIYVAKQQPPAN